MWFRRHVSNRKRAFSESHGGSANSVEKHAEENTRQDAASEKMWFKPHVSNGNEHFLNHMEVPQTP